MSSLEIAAMGVASAAIGAALAWFAAERGESRRQEHAERMYWRSVRLEAVTRLLATVDDYRDAVITYAFRRHLVERGLGEWGPRPPITQLRRDAEYASLLVPDTSAVASAISLLQARALSLPTNEPDLESEDWRVAAADVREAHTLVEEALRREIGLRQPPLPPGRIRRFLSGARRLLPGRDR